MAKKKQRNRKNQIKEINDGFSDALKGVGLTLQKQKQNVFTSQQILTYEESIAIYDSLGLASRIVDFLANRLISKFISFDFEDSKEIDNLIIDKNFRYLFHKLIIENYIVGGSLMVFVTNKDTKQPIQDGEELVRIDVFNKGHFKTQFTKKDIKPDYFEIYEYDTTYNKIDKNKIRYKADSSRCVWMRGVDVIREESYYDYWGFSIYQKMYNELSRLDIADDIISTLFKELKLDIYKIEGLAQVASTNGGKGLIKRLEAINLGKSISKSILIDTKEEYAQKFMDWNKTPEMIKILERRLVNCAGIPYNLIINRETNGLNDSGDIDLKVFYEEIVYHQQVSVYKPLKKALELLAQTSSVSLPQEWNFTFNPLEEMNSKENADIEKIKLESFEKLTNTLNTLLEKGLISSEDAKQKVEEFLDKK